MAYKHGVSAGILPSKNAAPVSGDGALPVYIGTAPVHLLADPVGALNTPILIQSYDDAVRQIGYSDNWDDFTLCEAVKAHFGNKLGNAGPIVVINVLDAATHNKAGTSEVTIENGVGYIDNVPVLLSTVQITGKTEGTDYNVEYENGRVKLTEITALGSPVTVAYDEVDASAVVDADVIGGTTADGVRSGISCIDLVYQRFNLVPTIMAAPGFSHVPAVYNAMITKAQKVNNHWDLTLAVDFPTDATVNTIAKAIQWRTDNGYTSLLSKGFWPKVMDGTDMYHGSTLAVWRMLMTDYDNDGTPNESPSNKQVPVTKTVLDANTPIEFDEIQANQLNAVGITTFCFIGGLWKLWGPHHLNYVYGADIDAEERFDSSIRMMRYITNTFQKNYMGDVDGPISRRKIEDILDRAQMWLNSLKAQEKVLLSQIDFLSLSNPEADMIEGDFVFDTRLTTTPPGKSLHFAVRHTTEGISTLFGGDK